MLVLTNEYLFPSQITKLNLSKWIVECIAEFVEWEAKLATKEKDGSLKKSREIITPSLSAPLLSVAAAAAPTAESFLDNKHLSVLYPSILSQLLSLPRSLAPSLPRFLCLSPRSLCPSLSLPLPPSPSLSLSLLPPSTPFSLSFTA